MFSNWLWHQRLQILVDAGEGLHLALGSHVFGPTHLLLTHGHSDHVLGVPGFLAARRFSKGASSKPLTILYPANSSFVPALQELIAQLWHGVTFPVSWVPISPGSEHGLTSGRAVQAFEARHVATHPALGYRIVERRQRLKAEFASLSKSEVEALAKQGRRDDLTETYTHPVFVHSGDAMPIAPSLAERADILVHDATFLDAADRREPIHATTEEALDVGRAAGVADLILCHLSVRYDRATVGPRLAAQLANSRFDGRCWLLDEDKIERIREPENLVVPFRPMPASLTREDVQRIADLARLELTPEELDTFTPQLAEILGYVEQIGALDTSNVAATSQVVQRPVERKDEPRPTLSRSDALGNAPDAAREAGLFKVPRVIG